MTALVTENLSLLSSAPSGIKKLRQLILTLAINGRLVPQDQTEQPAAELLHRIAAHKADCAARGRSRPPLEVVQPMESAAAPVAPAGWIWTTFGSATVCRDGERIPVSQIDREQRQKLYDYYGASGVIDKIDGYLFDKPLLLIGEDGANLVNRSSPIAFIARGQYWVNNHAHVIDGLTEGLLKYLELYVNAIDLKPYVTGTAQPKMNQAKLNAIPLALPPEAEQVRIVTKVDELMALCDRLEAEQADAEAAHAKLVEALLASLTQARDAADFRASWQQLAEHFHKLFTTEASVEALRQSVLELGVIGRLTSNGQEAEWPQVKLGSVAKLINGDRGSNYPNRSEYVPEGIPFINTGHINPDGSLDLESMHFLTREKFDSLRSGKIEPDDLVYCLRGATLGKTAFVRPFSEGAIASSLVILRFAKVVLPEFAYYFLVSPPGRRWIWKFNNGSAQPNLAASSVREYEIPLPSLEEQANVIGRITELLTLCDQLQLNLAQARQHHEHLSSVLVEQAVA